MVFGTKKRQHKQKTKVIQVQAQIGLKHLPKMVVSSQIIASLMFGMPDTSITRTIYVPGPGSGSGS